MHQQKAKHIWGDDKLHLRCRVANLEAAIRTRLANVAITVAVPLWAWSLGQATCLLKSIS